tara:strand:+ start:166 stop:636 length:471 start_codon:yes stop_codon:yes gene_type:complete
MTENKNSYRLMVVEDDDVDFMSIERNLNSIIDADIVRFNNAEDALAHIEAHKNGFDCYILDYILPGESGLEIIKAVRKRDDLTPIVMFTGKGNENVAVTAMKLGLTDYIVKDDIAESMRSVVNIIEQGMAIDSKVRNIESKLAKLKGRTGRLESDN